jgi:hypothetical protein
VPVSDRQRSSRTYRAPRDRRAVLTDDGELVPLGTRDWSAPNAGRRQH